MRLLFLAAILLLVGITFAACDPKQCSALSRPTGDYVCRYDDAYERYLEYYCTGDECVARTTDRLVEDCPYGCSLGTCITCSVQECEARSGFFSQPYCYANTVYKTYREYYCDFGKGCVYNDVARSVEVCDDDATCTSGRCGLCDPVECNAKDGFYDENFCKADNDAYRVYRDYSCSKDRCVFKQDDIKIADCQYGCDEGECTLPLCGNCDSKDSFAGEPYCKGNSVYRAFRDYFCGGARCEFNETERKVEDCSQCNGGKCVITPQKNERLIEFSISFSNETIERNITLLPKRIFNGLLFGSGEGRIDANGFVGSVSFHVLDTNNLGELGVYADGDKVFATRKAGQHAIAVNRNARQVIISTSTSGFIFWMPAVYDLDAVTAAVIGDKLRRNEFSFPLSRAELVNLKSAEVVSWPTGTRIRINNRLLESNIIDKDYLQSDNKIEFISLLNETFERKTAVRIVYEG